MRRVQEILRKKLECHLECSPILTRFVTTHINSYRGILIGPYAESLPGPCSHLSTVTAGDASDISEMQDVCISFRTENTNAIVASAEVIGPITQPSECKFHIFDALAAIEPGPVFI